MIDGKKPTGHLAALAERRDVVAGRRRAPDRVAAAEDVAARKRRSRNVQSALEAGAERRKLAEAVDDALARLAEAWPAYQEALRKGLGRPPRWPTSRRSSAAW